MAKKEAAKKETKSSQKSETISLNDIINKVKDNQREMDAKLAELSLMCSGKQCKGK